MTQQTSLRAYDIIKHNGTLSRQAEAIRQLIGAFPTGVTRKDIGYFCRFPYTSVVARVADLKAAQYVYVSGYRKDPHTGITIEVLNLSRLGAEI